MGWGTGSAAVKHCHGYYENQSVAMAASQIINQSESELL